MLMRNMSFIKPILTTNSVAQLISVHFCSMNIKGCLAIAKAFAERTSRLEIAE